MAKAETFGRKAVAGVLRIWLDSEDLGRLRVARGPHALWETVLSLQALQTGERPALAGWRERTLARLTTAPLLNAVRILRPLVPTRGYLPDFLTPPDGGGSLSAGVAAVVRTRARRVARELELLAAEGHAPSAALRMADGRLTGIGEALTLYHDGVLAPYAIRMQALVDADRALRARAMLDGGVEGLLDTLRPVIRRGGPLLLEADYPVDQDLCLDGRGLLLVPSVFCRHYPITLRDTSLPPTLVYPIGRDGDPEEDDGVDDALDALMGGTRGKVLRYLDEVGCSTTELAGRLGISIASASQHASVLRRNGLVVSRRSGRTMLHRRTVLGEALINRGDDISRSNGLPTDPHQQHPTPPSPATTAH